mgnify:CR=1 FL=1
MLLAVMFDGEPVASLFLTWFSADHTWRYWLAFDVFEALSRRVFGVSLVLLQGCEPDLPFFDLGDQALGVHHFTVVEEDAVTSFAFSWCPVNGPVGPVTGIQSAEMLVQSILFRGIDQHVHYVLSPRDTVSEGT